MSSYVGNNGMQKQIMVVITCPQKQKTYNIEVETDTTIGELGNELFSALDCQPNEQCVLYYNGQALSNDQTFQHYGIIKGRQIEIKIEKIAQQPPAQNDYFAQNNQLPYAQQNNNRSSNFNQGGNLAPSNFMPSLQDINLTILVNQTQRKYQMKVNRIHQVRELKVKLSNTMQLPPDTRITLLYNGTTLNENQTFETQGVPDQAEIEANILRTGGFLL